MSFMCPVFHRTEIRKCVLISYFLYLIIDVVVPKRFRGPTRMDRVHTRSIDKRVVIDMNAKFQPVSEDDRVVTEFGNFLGTISKRCVSLTYADWRHVPSNLKDTMWNYVKVTY